MQHHVYFWIKDEHKNSEDLAAFESGLERLLKTDGIQAGGWGKPAPTAVRPVTDNTFDYGLYLSFASIDDHDAYQIHPEHDVFVDSYKHLWEQVRVSDVE
jgi:hypothetical protein